MGLSDWCKPNEPRNAKRWCRRKEARPSELTAAALSLFVERGFAATRLEDVARRAGVSKGTLYLYFANKEELFKAVIGEGIVPLIAEGEALFERMSDDPEGLLRTLVLTWWARIGATELGGVIKLMVAESGNFPDVAAYFHREVVQRGRALLRHALELGIERGVFRPMDVNMQVRVLWAPVLMASIWRFSFGVCETEELPADTYFEAYFDVILNGIRAGSGAAS